MVRGTNLRPIIPKSVNFHNFAGLILSLCTYDLSLSTYHFQIWQFYLLFSGVLSSSVDEILITGPCQKLKRLPWKGLLTKGSSGRNNFLVLSDLLVVLTYLCSYTVL